MSHSFETIDYAIIPGVAALGTAAAFSFMNPDMAFGISMRMGGLGAVGTVLGMYLFQYVKPQVTEFRDARRSKHVAADTPPAVQHVSQKPSGF